jgi:hypothetical protein
MAFVAYDFIYGGMESERYGLKIIDIDGNGVVNSMASSNVQIVNDTVRRRAVPFDYGVQKAPVLAFPLTFGSEEPLDKFDQRIIVSGFLGKKQTSGWIYSNVI